MTGRFSLAARIASIMAAALLTGWVCVTAYYYRADAGALTAHPPPERIAAIVGLIERTQASEREFALRAVSSDTLKVRMASPGEAPAEVHVDLDEKWLQPYAAALDGRPVVVSAAPASTRDRAFPRLFAFTTNALELNVGLKDGATLVLEARAPVVVTRLGLPVGFGAGLIGTLIALFALIVMQRETRPLARLARAVDRMEIIEQHAPIPQSRGSAAEIQALIDAFNRLGDRLSMLLRARMALLGGISHDVRTFATRLRLRLDQIPDDAEREKAEGDIADMIRLLDDALLASRAGAGELVQELVEFDDIVRSEVDDRKASGAPVSLESDGRAALVLGDRVALRRIAANLIDNAVAYGRVAHVGLAVSASSVFLTVEDEGPGVPIDKRAELLEPFVRLEASRNRRTGGSGLGLAIVRALAEAHGASLSIDDATSGGARFEVIIPLFEPTANAVPQES